MGNLIELTKRSLYSIGIIVLIFCSCNENKIDKGNRNPITSVIKLESAQLFNDYEIAREFIDLTSVYGEIARIENTKVDSIWFRAINFNNSLGNSSSKFRPLLPFHKYNIIENINGNTSTVELTPTNKSSKKIIYSLNLKNNQWIVIKIKYE